MSDVILPNVFAKLLMIASAMGKLEQIFSFIENPTLLAEIHALTAPTTAVKPPLTNNEMDKLGPILNWGYGRIVAVAEGKYSCDGTDPFRTVINGKTLVKAMVEFMTRQEIYDTLSKAMGPRFAKCYVPMTKTTAASASAPVVTAPVVTALVVTAPVVTVVVPTVTVVASTPASNPDPPLIMTKWGP